MYKEVLRSIEGVGIFPTISLVIFLAFFIGLLFHLYRKGKSHWDDAAHLPLEPDETIRNFDKKETDL